jgi:MYXO-CTERM domain-containing protein
MLSILRRDSSTRGGQMAASTGWGQPVARHHAALVALGIALVLGWQTFAHETAVGNTGGDFIVYVRAARTLLAGANPYHEDVLLYPLASIVIVLPVARLHPVLGVAIFSVAGGLALSYGLLRRFGWPGLVMLLSPSFFLGWYYMQWSPLIVAGALLPWLGGIGAAKPNLALATFAYRPSWQTIVGGLVLAAISWLLLPTWLTDWFAAVAREPTAHTPPLRWPVGLLGLLGLLRWRRREGRALVVMTLSPLNPQFYDHLGVWLAAASWRDSLVLSACGWVGFLAFLATAPHDLTKNPLPAHLSVALGVYLPAALLLLRHPNMAEPSAGGVVGDVPETREEGVTTVYTG